ncbi:hypothetical protein CR513_19381, partial [Mucuna pruriens]
MAKHHFTPYHHLLNPPSAQFRSRQMATPLGRKHVLEKVLSSNGERRDILSQINVAITTMANHNAAGHALASNTAGPPPHVVRDLPYGMPYSWNTEDPSNEEQE